MDTPLVDLVSLVDAYSSSHSTGSSSLKSCIWNISKARRQKGGFHMGDVNVYSAIDVREELCARARLQCNGGEEPMLMEEAGENKEFEYCELEGEDSFVMYLDGIPKKEDVIPANDFSEKRDLEGLRNRKKGSGSSTAQRRKKEWSEELLDDEDEKKLRNADPLELFGGLTPVPLKVAQTKARESLTAYVEAANLAAEILRITNLLPKNEK